MDTNSEYIKKLVNKQTKTVLNIGSAWFFGISLAILSIFYALTFRKGHYWVGDDLQYIRHAINLIEGKLYVDPLHITNAIATVGPQMYPPIFPLILSVVYGLFGLNFVAMKVVLIAFFISSLVFVKTLVKQRLSEAGAIFLVFFLGLNPELWDFKDRILSEFPFMFFVFLALLLMQLKDNKATYVIAMFLGVVMYLSYGIREIAIVLPLTLITYELWHYRRVTRHSMFVIGLFVLLVVIQKLVLGSVSMHSEYKQQLDLLMESGATAPTAFSYVNTDLENIIKQGERYLWSLYGILQIKYLPFGGYFFLFANICVLTGYVTALFRKISITEIYVTGYFCALLIFAGFDGFRYLLPILPFYVFYLISGFLKLIVLAPYFKKIGVISAILTVAFVNFMGFLDKALILEEHYERSNSLDQLYSYVVAKTATTDVLVATNPRVLSFFTRRRASAYPFHKNDADWFMKYLRVIDARYLITTTTSSTQTLLDERKLDLLFKNYRDSFSLVFNNDFFKVYELTNL